MTTSLTIDVWGPKAWGFLHACTFTYPDLPTLEDRKQMYNLLASLPHTLPCSVCRKHFKEFIDTSANTPQSFVFDNRTQLSKWLVDVHNDVNRRNNKPLMSFEAVQEMYLPSSSVCSPPGAFKTEANPFAHAIMYFTWSVVTLVICIVLTKFVFRCRSCERESHDHRPGAFS